MGETYGKAEAVSRRREGNVLAQEANLLVQGADPLLFVIKAAVELADQLVRAENGFLTLLLQLRSKKDNLLCKDSLNVRRPV